MSQMKIVFLPIVFAGLLSCGFYKKNRDDSNVMNDNDLNQALAVDSLCKNIESYNLSSYSAELKRSFNIFWTAVEKNHNEQTELEATSCLQLENWARNPTNKLNEQTGLYLDMSNYRMTDDMLSSLIRYLFTPGYRSFLIEPAKARIYGLDLSNNLLLEWEKIATEPLFRELVYLNLSNNNLTGNLANTFKGIKFKETISVLNLSNNNKGEVNGRITGLVGGIGTFRDFAKKFPLHVSDFPNLIYLDLSNNRLGDGEDFIDGKTEIGFLNLSHQKKPISLTINVDPPINGENRVEGFPIFDFFHLEMDNSFGLTSPANEIFLNEIGEVGSYSLKVKNIDARLYGKNDFIDLRGERTIDFFAPIKGSDGLPTNSSVANVTNDAKVIFANQETCNDTRMFAKRCITDNKIEMPLGGCKYYEAVKSLRSIIEEDPELLKNFDESLKKYQLYCGF